MIPRKKEGWFPFLSLYFLSVETLFFFSNLAFLQKIISIKGQCGWILLLLFVVVIVVVSRRFRRLPAATRSWSPCWGTPRALVMISCSCLPTWRTFGQSPSRSSGTPLDGTCFNIDKNNKKAIRKMAIWLQKLFWTRHSPMVWWLQDCDVQVAWGDNQDLTATAGLKVQLFC